MRILVDMDDVIADLQGRIEQIWRELHPEHKLFPSGRRSSYYIGAELNDPHLISDIWHILHGPGLFSSLEPVAGSLQAIERMLDDGNEVAIVTSAGVSFPNAASEKYQWVKDRFGQHLLAKLVITPSKYLVDGDVLIDDKPEIYREEDASWQHVLFDRPYNQEIDKPRLDWNNWRQTLSNL